MDTRNLSGAVLMMLAFTAGCTASRGVDESGSVRILKVQCTTASAVDLGACQARASQLCNGVARLRGIDARTEAGSAGSSGKFQLYHVSASYECVSAKDAEPRVAEIYGFPA